MQKRTKGWLGFIACPVLMDAGSRSSFSLPEKRTDLVERIYAGPELEVPGRRHSTSGKSLRLSRSAKRGATSRGGEAPADLLVRALITVTNGNERKGEQRRKSNTRGIRGQEEIGR